ALKKMIRGPKDWITAECAHELKSLGFGDQLTDLPSILVASKARVVEWEADGRLRIRQRARRVQQLSCGSTEVSLQRLRWLHEWRDRCFVLTLDRAAERVNVHRRANPAAFQWHRKEGWQKHAMEQLHGFELDALMGLDWGRQGERAVVDWANSVHALYRVHNGCRHGRLTLQDINGAFDGFLREACGRSTE
ncbi:unnamed protein product, partial [Prorocentrum cordatum]